MEHAEVKSSVLTLLSFWILGLCNNFGYVVMLSSAHDILQSDQKTNETVNSQNSTTEDFARECNHLSTGVILLADIIPGLLIKIISPFFALRINRRLSICIGLTIASFVTVARAKTELVAAIGVALTSVGAGLGETTLLTYMANYERNVITSWASGTGAAGILGALTYAGLTGVFHMSPSSTMYLMLLVPTLMAVSFWLLLEHPKKKDFEEITVSDTRMQNLSICKKISYVPALLKFMIPLGLVYFFEYLINQGLFELVYFDNIWLTHAEQYRWYQVLYQGLNVVYFLTESIYSYTPSIIIVFAMICFEGLLGGSSYSNTFHQVMLKVPKEEQGFSMAMTSLSDSVGISLSGILAIPLHNRICHIPK